MKSYVLLNASSPQDLTYLVNDLLSKGWDLHGNPYSLVHPGDMHTSSGVYFYQAMTQVSDKNKENKKS